MNALISNAKGRGANQTPSGYTRILGNDDLGNLISKLQATVISAGTELEHLLWERCNQIEHIDSYLEADIYPTGVYVATKKQIKNSIIAEKSFEPDFIAFERTENNNQYCYVIEVKDGDQFDTKKASGERKHLHDYGSFIAQRIQFIVKPIVCSFNAVNREQIVSGFKNKITIDEARTGKELCTLLGIDYDEILNVRKYHQKENIHLFIKSLLEISEAKEMIIQHLKKELN